MEDLTSGARTRIPHDLLHPIFEHLERYKPSLCAISLSSSIFRHEAQRILFHDVATIGNDWAHLKFLRSVAASPMRLALFVRAYRLSFCRDDCHGLSEELLNVLRDALESMCNLECLDLDLEVPHIARGSPSKIAWILRGCTFNLQRFNWYYPADEEADEIITEFLPRREGLKHLGIYPPWKLQNTRPPLFDVMCPQLVSLKGEWDMIKALLPGHKIATLNFQSGGPYPYDADIDPLVPLLERITAFSCVSDSKSGERILRLCPSVSVLELKNFDENDYVQYPTMRMVSSFRLLHTLVLTRADLTVKSLGEFQQLARRLFEKSGLSLPCVDIEIDEGRGVYARFKRSPGSAPEEVNTSEVRKLWLSE